MEMIHVCLFSSLKLKASKVITGSTLLLPSIVILVFLKGTCLLFTSAFIIAVQAFQDVIRTENLSDINHYREFIIAELQHTDIVFIDFQKEKKAGISAFFVVYFTISILCVLGIQRTPAPKLSAIYLRGTIVLSFMIIAFSPSTVRVRT